MEEVQKEDEWSVTEKSNTAAAGARTESKAWQLTVSTQNLFRATHVNPIKPVCRINQPS